MVLLGSFSLHLLYPSEAELMTHLFPEGEETQCKWLEFSKKENSQCCLISIYQDEIYLCWWLARNTSGISRVICKRLSKMHPLQTNRLWLSVFRHNLYSFPLCCLKNDTQKDEKKATPLAGFPSQEHPGILTQGAAPPKEVNAGTLAVEQWDKGRWWRATEQLGKEQSFLGHMSRALIRDKSGKELF